MLSLEREIKIRGISNAVVTIIDTKAKQQGISRNDYLLNLLRLDVERDLIKEERAYMEQAVTRTANAFEVVAHQLDGIETNYQKIFMMLAMLMGMSKEEVEQVLAGYIVSNGDEVNE